MTEILWHGRGGQGAFSAAKLLGATYSLKEGSYSLAFLSFGPERRGLGSAVVLEFLLYYITKPEYQLEVREAVYLDSILSLF